MDISKVTDITELKAMAFDAIQAIEVNQQNLRIIQQRIEELNAAPPMPPAPHHAKK